MVSTGFPKSGDAVKRKADGLVGEVYASDPDKDILTVRWSARSGHNTLVCTSEQLFRDWDLIGSGKSITGGFVGRAAILIVIAALFVVCIYGFTYYSGCSSFKYPESILGHERTFVNGDEMHVFALKLQGDEAMDMLAAAADMKAVINRELKDGSSDQYIDFHLLGDSEKAGIARSLMKVGKDYGNTDLSNAFDIWYKMEDIKKIDFDNISVPRLLNLGHVYMVFPLGTDVAGKYCDKNRELSQVFCSNSSWEIFNR
jgi:hypothetical protein